MNKEFKREREFTYRLEEHNAKKLINLIMNNKYIHIKDFIFVVENPKVNSELHMISTKDYNFSNIPEGNKYRLKFRYKKNGSKVKIQYSCKAYEMGKRYENKININNDFCSAYEYFMKMMPVNNVIYKTSYEFTLIDHLNGCKLLLSIDCCYIVDPSNPGEISNPFFFLEIEEEKGIKLEEFISSEFFAENIINLIGPSDHKNSKIVLAENLYKDHELNLKSANELKKYVSDFYTNNKAQINYFINNITNNKSIVIPRGEKPIERGTYTEKEFKFLGENAKDKVLSIVKSLIANNWYLIKTQGRLINDIYFDTDNFTLYNNQYSFRIRQRAKGDGWISCLKIPDHSVENYLERRTIRSAITNKEVLMYKTDNIPGEAYINTQRVIKNIEKQDMLIKPIVYIVQLRERYVVRSYDYKDDNLTNLSEDDLKNEHYLIRSGEVLHIIFDRVIAYDISNLDISRLIHWGELNLSTANLKSKEFISCEIEPTHRLDIKNAAEELFDELILALNEIGYNKILQDKYQLGVNALNIFNN